MAKHYKQVTINNGTSLSSSIDLGESSVVGIQMPAAWTAADLSFQGSMDDSSFGNLMEKPGTEYQVSAAANQLIPLSSSLFNALRFLKIRSGTSSVPVNQAAARILTLILEG